jgi:uncharacterized membrane protein YcjF (UPF0283 family)
MFFYRILQVVGVIGVLGCVFLMLQATPLIGEGWNRARLLYGGAGAIPALALIAIGEIGRMLRRVRLAMIRTEAALARIEKRLEN